MVRQKSVCSAFSTTSSSCPTLAPVMQSADFGDFDHRLIFIFVLSFLENLIDVDCGEGRRSLNQVAEPRRILLHEYFFSAWVICLLIPAFMGVRRCRLEAEVTAAPFNV
jgi:hypothetical protein